MSEGAGGTAAILSIGREILRGRTLDTNARFLAGRLTALGVEVARIAVADDALPSIEREFASCLALAPRLVVSTGGLGPTFDDLTTEGLSLALGLPLRPHPGALAWVEEAYRDLSRRRLVASAALTPEREKMARLPEGARPIRNRWGAAPGIAIEARGTRIYCLPGVPDEMTGMWTAEVEPEIAALFPDLAGAAAEDVDLEVRDESSLAPILRGLMEEFPGVYAKSRVAGAKETIRIVVTLSAEGAARARLRDAAERLKVRVRAAGLG